MEQARLIIDSPKLGAWNMAVDQALLETADSTGMTTLRFYRWSEPTLSLGYFQNHADRSSHSASENCSLVRRRTGGGAIVHDKEITYSLCVPSGNRWSSRNSELYDLMHQVIIELLDESGVEAKLYGNPSELPPDKNIVVDQKAFLCFQRRAAGDVVLNNHKVVGSAQRRQKNAILQHGSILIEKSDFAPELEGIDDLSRASWRFEETAKNIASKSGNRLRMQFIRGKLQASEKEAAERAFSAQFNNDQWNLRR